MEAARWQQEAAAEEAEGQEGGQWEEGDDDGFEYVDGGDLDADAEEEDLTLDEYDPREHPSPRRGKHKERVRVRVRASPPPGTGSHATRAADASSSGSAGGGGGGWYLGKLTGRLLRRGLLALVGEEEGARRRTDGAPVVARLRVRLKGVRGLKGALNPYLEVICEGARRVVKPERAREDGGGEGGGGAAALDPEWGEAAFTFAVTDITTNVHVLLLDKVSVVVDFDGRGWVGWDDGGDGRPHVCWR